MRLTWSEEKPPVFPGALLMCSILGALAVKLFAMVTRLHLLITQEAASLSSVGHDNPSVCPDYGLSVEVVVLAEVASDLAIVTAGLHCDTPFRSEWLKLVRAVMHLYIEG